MRVSRKIAVVGAGAFTSIAIPRFRAGAAEFSYKWGHSFPASHPTGIRVHELADRITQESGGRLEIKDFPSSQLGNDPSMFTQVRAGALELQLVSVAQLEPLTSAAGLTLIPLAFDGFKRAWEAADGQLGAYMRAAIRKLGVYVSEKFWDNGGLHQLIVVSRPISKPDDLKGLKIWIPPSPVVTAFYKALGGSPTTLPINEIYPGLQTHLIDGVQAALINMQFFKFYEVGKFVSMMNLSWGGVANVANADAIAKLPRNLQDLVIRLTDQYALLQRGDVQRGQDAAAADLRNRGLTFNDADVAAFKAVIRSAGLYKEWRDHYGEEGWAALEKSAGTLA